MLFNSAEFIFVFLPITLLVYWLLGARSTVAAILWITAASFVFYGWEHPEFLKLICVSLVLNYLISLAIGARPLGSLSRRLLLYTGVAMNLGVIAYYKYANFFLDSVNSIAGSDYTFQKLILPIGISFYTFQQIAYLVDRSRDEIENASFLNYCLFVTYFPQLIAGPIVHPSEILPQFKQTGVARFTAENFSIGLTIFIIGLVKKVLIADGLIDYSSVEFDAGRTGFKPGFFDAWSAALAYMLQLYFDFSGYSDMAIGLGRMCGVQLPLNFNSPYQATSIIDFWRRWHMTLSRFLRDYVYIPLGGGRVAPWRRHANLTITMLLGGLWHGAGWTFVIWGGLHAGYLIINHAWVAFKKATGKPETWFPFGGRVGAQTLTLLAVLCGWVLFRSPNIASAKAVFQGMLGMNGVVLPISWLDPERTFSTIALKLQAMGVHFMDMPFFDRWSEVFHVGAVLALALWAPNTQQIMAKLNPALQKVTEMGRVAKAPWMGFEFNVRWAVWLSILTSWAILRLYRVSEFLYFQF